MSSGPRILQVLADTDGTPAHLAAVDLHAALGAAGAEVRTVALTPGRSGELAAVVPAIAPARRTVAALTALRGEARWADAVLFHGIRSLPPAVDRTRSLPAVLLRVLAGEDVPERRLARLASRVALTLLVDDDAPRFAAVHRAGARRTVVPVGVSAVADVVLGAVAPDERGSAAP